MKRRTFLKGLAAAALSSLLPSRSSGAHSVEKAIPDPGREKNLYFRHDGSSYHAHKPEPSHIHDALRYAIPHNDDLGYYGGLQWSKKVQRELNRRRSKAVDRLIFNRIKR